MRERLTKRNPDGSVGIAEFRYYNYDDFQKMARKLADYEDAEEQGRIVVLPYKIGDTVWEINSENPFEDELKVMETRVEDLFVGTSLDLHHIDSNFLFTNKEDADKALDKMRCEFDNKHHLFKGTHKPFLLVDSEGHIVVNKE